MLKYSLILTLFICSIVPSCWSDGNKCIVCDSKDTDCISRDPCTFEPDNDGRENAECFTSHKNDHVIRGYYESGKECEEPICKKCKNDKEKPEEPCNNECFPPIKCYDGTNEKTCDSAKLACQQCFDIGTSTMTQTCGASNAAKCGTCYADKCNDGFLCYSCLTGENCAASNGQPEINPKDAKGCYIKLKDEKTERGYVGKTDTFCDNDPKCRITEGHLSNTGVFFDDHRKCYQCSSGDKQCGDEQNGEINLKYCEKYVANDECYILEDAKGIKRGCKSDDNQVCASESKCYTCTGNGCNKRDKIYQPELKCITCENENCVFGKSSTEGKRCETAINFYEEEFCYTKEINTNTVKRGCGGKERNVCADGCAESCKTDGCNNKNFFKQKCARCRDDDGDARANCTKGGGSFLDQTCSKTADITEATRGCYVMRHDGTIFRGCIADLPFDEMHMCLKNNTNNCLICTDVNCNTYDLPNGSSRSAEIGIAAFFLFIASFLNRNVF